MFYWVEILLAACVPLAVGFTFWLRTKSPDAFDMQTLRVLTISVMLPILAVLTLEEFFSGGDALAALAGFLVAYLFGNIKQEK